MIVGVAHMAAGLTSRRVLRARGLFLLLFLAWILDPVSSPESRTNKNVYPHSPADEFLQQAGNICQYDDLSNLMLTIVSGRPFNLVSHRNLLICHREGRLTPIARLAAN